SRAVAISPATLPFGGGRRGRSRRGPGNRVTRMARRSRTTERCACTPPASAIWPCRHFTPPGGFHATFHPTGHGRLTPRGDTVHMDKATGSPRRAAWHSRSTNRRWVMNKVGANANFEEPASLVRITTGGSEREVAI